MNFDIVMKVNEALDKIGKILNVEKGLIFNNDDKNLLAGFSFDSKSIDSEIQTDIIQSIKPLEEYFDINHIIFNQRVVIFQGTLKEKLCTK